MTKLLTALFAAACVTMAGSVVAADNSPSTSPNSNAPTQQEQVPAQGDTGSSAGSTQAQPGGDSANQNAGGQMENLPLAAALKKCDNLNGKKKNDCVDAANKKFGQM